MALEREAKFQVESHGEIRERLASGGAQRLGCVLETNVIFDRPDGSLRGKGIGLRIRTTKDVETSERLTTMTLKGPVTPGPFKLREELEIEVSDLDTAVTMLEGLGFVRILQYQKRRESWRLDDCRVELDEPPHIGLFVEIEGPSDTAIEDARRVLGLEQSPHIRGSYPAMLMSYCKEHGVVDRTLPLSTSEVEDS